MNAAAMRVMLGGVMLGAVAACGETVTVSVGQLVDSIDLTRCVGEDVVCDLARASEAPGAIQPRSAPVTDCMSSEEPAWHVAWARAIDTLPCTDGLCEAEQLEFAADGSIWTAAKTVDAGQAKLLLGHYAADGTLLLENAVDTWALPGDPNARIDLSLASDSQGHALVALAWQPSEPTRIGSIVKYDRTGDPVGRRALLEGIGSNDSFSLKIGPRDEVLLMVGAADESRLAQLDSSLRLQWVQSRALPAALDMLLDEDLGPVLVINETQLNSLYRFGLHWFDWHGNVHSSLTLSSLSRYVRTRNGAVISMEGGAVDKVFREVGRDGQVRWSRRIVSAPTLERLRSYSEVSSQQVDAEGVVYHFVQRTSDSDPPVTRNALFRLDPATEDCSFARIDVSQPASSSARRASADAGVDSAPDTQLAVDSFFINQRGDFYILANTGLSGGRVIGKLER